MVNFAHLDAAGLGFVGSVPPSDCPDLLALPATDRHLVDPARFAELTALETRRVVYGTARRVVLTHSPTLHAAQTLTKTSAKLSEPADTLARGHTRRSRTQVEAEITRILSNPWTARVISYQLTGASPGPPRVLKATTYNCRIVTEPQETRMTDPIAFKSDVLVALREALLLQRFTEVLTPVARQADLGSGRRAPVELGERRYLRSMIGPALRYHLQFRPRVFEIGPCFRLDTPDATHSREFAMLDLYAAGENFEFLFILAEKLVEGFLGTGFERVSVAGRIHDLFGINLREEPLGDLPERMAKYVGAPEEAPLQESLETFVSRELEPCSVGNGIFLWEFPVGGNEPCAKQTPGTIGILNRFELIVDGLEVMHGYEDEPDNEAFVRCATKVGLYDQEQALLQDEIAQGRVPAESVGLGMGIERLCMAATGIKDIAVFQQFGPY